MAPISGPRYRDHGELTEQGIVNIISYGHLAKELAGTMLAFV